MESTTILLENASQWKYVGEGGKHAVFEYNDGKEDRDASTASLFKGKLLRISKAVLRGETTTAREETTRNVFYMQHVVAPYLQDFVDVPEMVVLEAKFVQQLWESALASGKIPAARRKDWETSQEQEQRCNGNNIIHEKMICFGMLLADYRCGRQSGNSRFTIELKPKAGYVAFSPLVDPAHRTKYQQSRFVSLQHLQQRGLWQKGWQCVHDESGGNGEDETTAISHYDPLDLFSMDAERISKAIEALWKTPQNNLRIYNSSGERITPKDAPLFLQEALTTVLTGSRAQSLLQKILAWQRLDILDVDGACIVYERLVELIMMKEGRNGDEGARHAAAEYKAQQLVDAMNEPDLTQDFDGDNPSIPTLQTSPFWYSNDDNNRYSTASPIYRFCTMVEEFQQGLQKGTLDNPPFLDQMRDALLQCIQNTFGIAECVYLLRNWLLSLTMCDVSIFITLEEMEDEDEDAHDNIIAVGDNNNTTTTKRCCFRYSLHVIDCDPKPAKKLHGRAEKEKAFAKLNC